ncbi:hypothetical protein C7S14_0490 [Burkholderia cepacia]|nr:hypothetical protein C7S14_0490 [Burkholderia cepacia]
MPLLEALPQRIVLHLLPLVIVGRERIGQRRQRSAAGGRRCRGSVCDAMCRAAGGESEWRPRNAGRCPREGDDDGNPDCGRTPPSPQTRYEKDVLRFAHQLPWRRQACACVKSA